MAAATAAAAPPFYFCNVATSKREPAGRHSVSEQEAGEGRKPVASRGEGRRERGMDVSRIRDQKVGQNQAETADVHVCFLVCTRVHVCISAFCCHWRNETRLREQLSSEPTAAGRQQIPEITCNGWSPRSGDTGADLLSHIKPKTASSIETTVRCADPSRTGVTRTKKTTTHCLFCQLDRNEDRSNHRYNWGGWGGVVLCSNSLKGNYQQTHFN